MSEVSQSRFVRVAFVVAKLRAGEDSFFLLRYNPKWHDLNLIGGHEDAKDAGNLARTARRELREEVPLIRGYSEYRLEALSGPTFFGPIISKSKNVSSTYEAYFYLLTIDESPARLVHMLTGKSKNVWVEQRKLLSPSRFKLSNYIRLLDHSIEGGLRAIPFSSNSNLISIRNHFEGVSGDQLRFHF